MDGGTELQRQGETQREPGGPACLLERSGVQPPFLCATTPPQVPKASPLASRNSVTRTQPQRQPRLKGNPGKPHAAGVPPWGGEKGGRGGAPEKARLCPSPPTRSSLPLSHAPNPPGLFPTHQPHPEGRGLWGRSGSQTATPTPTPGPGCGRPDSGLVSPRLLLSLCLSFPWSVTVSSPRSSGWVQGSLRGRHIQCFSVHFPTAPHPQRSSDPRSGHLEDAEMATGQAEGRCLGACREQSLTWGCLFSSRKGGNGSAKGSAWSRSPGEEVGSRDSNPRPSEPRASWNPSLGERLRADSTRETER